ncbi:MAG TPA: STAS-like domain-containing protein [Solirubrobacterales bacterium]|nr:STAS-like domain-containing protein [Solirubrobacterales bacterium]
MAYSYALAEHGKTLATRPLGQELRTDLVQKAGSAAVVALDFSGILSTSHSFADEFVARLVEEVKTGEVTFSINISGASPDVERVVLKALERRRVDAPALV